MGEVKGQHLVVHVAASEARRRLKGYGFGVRKIQSAGRGQALIIHTATGEHLRELESLFRDALTPPATAEEEIATEDAEDADKT